MSNNNPLSIKEKVIKTEVYLDGQVVDTEERTEICVFVDGTEELEIPLGHFYHLDNYQNALDFIENAEVIDYRLPPDVFSVGSKAWVYDGCEKQIIKVKINTRCDRLDIQFNDIVRYTAINYGDCINYVSSKYGVDEVFKELKLNPEEFIRYE